MEDKYKSKEEQEQLEDVQKIDGIMFALETTGQLEKIKKRLGVIDIQKKLDLIYELLLAIQEGLENE